MKKHVPDPLEETMENPDLPPLTPAQGPESASAPARRGRRVMLTVGAVLVVLAVAGLRLAGG